MMPENRSPSNVSLEDLLRLKRAERPPAEFWTQFEREFRTRQLAAAVEKKRWWFSLPQAFARFSRLQLPLGATAVLAVTFLTVREYRDATAPLEPSISRQETALVAPAADSAPAPATNHRAVDPVVGTTDLAEQDSDPAPAVATAVPATRELTDMVPWVGSALQSEQLDSALSPSARSIAANLAAAVAVEPELSRVLTSTPIVQPRAQAIREPLADVRTPGAARRARLLASYTEGASQPAAEEERSTEVRDRLVSRLSEEQLYETVRRLSGSGDRLIVKF